MGFNMNNGEKDRTVYRLVMFLFGFSTPVSFYLTLYCNRCM